MAQALKKGAGFAIGIDHPDYTVSFTNIEPGARTSLVADLVA